MRSSIPTSTIDPLGQKLGDETLQTVLLAAKRHRWDAEKRVATLDHKSPIDIAITPGLQTASAPR